MPQTTIWVPEVDVGMFERAKQVLGQSLSQTVRDCVRRELSRHGEPVALLGNKPSARIVVTVNDDGAPKRVAFEGRWIIDPDDPEPGEITPFDRKAFAVALTAKGNVGVYWVKESKYKVPTDEDETGYGAPVFEWVADDAGFLDFYESFDAAVEAGVPKNIIARAKIKADLDDVEELDV